MATIKRRLIASFVYDLGKSKTAMYAPCVNMYWDISEECIKMYVRYAWQDFTETISYDKFKEALKKFSLVDMPKFSITERTTYKGDFEIEDSYHLSDFGKSLIASKNKEQVIKWISNNVQF